MIEVTAQSYIYALHTLMVCAIFSVVIVIFSLRDKRPPVSTIRFYLAYFVLGLMGWFFLAFKQLGHIDLGVLPDYIFYVICSGFLLIAVTEYKWSWLRTRLVVFLHLFVIACIVFIPGESNQLLVLSGYAIVNYALITVSSLEQALKVKNIGYAIIGFATLSAATIAIYQCYTIVVLDNLVLAYNAAFMVSTVGFVVVGIGFLAVIIIHENKHLQSLALSDPLTGLLNRRGLEHTLRVTLSDAERNDHAVSAMVIDIDHFKEINDSYGHEAGDLVLQSFAHAMRKTCRSCDVSCRLGGEEFLIIMPSTTMVNAVKLAERLRSHIESQEISIGERIITVTASFGVSVQQGKIELDGLIKDADKAVYEAKNAGRNQVYQS